MNNELQQFYARRPGGKRGSLESNGRQWWADGASMEIAGARGTGEMRSAWEPSTDPATLLGAKRTFAALKLAQEEAAFHRFKQECLQLSNPTNCDSVSEPPPDAEVQLHAGRERVRALREQLQRLDQEISQSQEATVQRQRRAQFQERADRLQSRGMAIMAINLD